MTRDDRCHNDHEVAFIGRVTAGVSHELMNVLATIRESSGLIEDLMAIDDTPFPYREKLLKKLTTIRGQVNRGMEIGDRLNRFAHSMDNRIVRLEVNELLGQLASVMKRSAGMRQVDVRAEAAESPVEIEADPIQLQTILAACIEYCLDRTATGGVITVGCRREDGGITIFCKGNPGLAPAEDAGSRATRVAPYNGVLDAFRDNLSTLDNHGGPGFGLFLPFHFSPK